MKMDKVLKAEEIFWYQRSRSKWLREGDGNTRYFHRIANGRRKNQITRLMVDNEEVQSFEKIAKEVKEFFAHLYKKEDYERPIIGNLFSSTIPSEWAREIEKPFSEEEVFNAVFGMDEAKAPGPDGFSMLFYQECWESIKEDLMKVFE